MSDRLQTPRLLLLDLRANHLPGRFVAPGRLAAKPVLLSSATTLPRAR